MSWSNYNRYFLGSKWFDWVLPWPRSRDPGELEAEAKREGDALAEAEDRIKHANRDALKVLMAGVGTLIELEAERRRSVDTRLSTIVGLSSVAATVVLGLVVAQAAGTLRLQEGVARLLVAGLAFYLVVQLWDAIFWAIRGQSRHGYRVDTVTNLLPQPDATEEAQLRQRVLSWVQQLQFNQASANRKVTAMAVAHRAATNFAGGLLLLALLGVTLVLRGAPTSDGLEALRGNAELRTLLRGPAGPMGVPGPPGPPGPRGPPGVPAPAAVPAGASPGAVPEAQGGAGSRE